MPSAASLALNRCQRRSVTSASSAAYSVALSTGTQSNLVCALPLPATSENAMGVWPRWRFDSSSMPKPAKPAAALVAGIGHQHGVVIGREADAIAAHHHEVVFDILADLQHAAVFEQRLEAGNGVLHRQLRDLARAREIEAVAGAVAERDVAGAVRLQRERDAAEPRGHGVEVRRLGVEGDEALFGRRRDPVFERLQIRHLHVAAAVEGEGLQPIRDALRFGGGAIRGGGLLLCRARRLSASRRRRARAHGLRRGQAARRRRLPKCVSSAS